MAVNMTSEGASLNLKREVDRYSTFHNWPGLVSSRDLAYAGFYYGGINDTVRCVFCEGSLNKWKEGEIPILEHQKHFPFCRFVRGITVGNVVRPGMPDPFPTLPDEAGHDVCGIHKIITLSSSLKYRVLPNGKRVENEVDLKELGIIKLRSPVMPEFVTEESRLLTFKDWPVSLKPTPTELAKAGLIYTGFSDKLQCFYCGGGLNQWKAQDDAWIEHARIFPNCQFVLMKKGKQFIDKALKVNQQAEESTSLGLMAVKKEIEPNTQKEQSVEQPQTSSTDMQNNCVICLEGTKEIILLPCSHLCSCEECGIRIITCPICRARIRAVIRVYTS